MGTRGGIVTGVRTDLGRLLTVWRSLAFPDQLDPHPVRGPWRPGTTREHLTFWTWSVLGLLLICAIYPFAVVGLWVRYVSRGFDRVAAALGLLAVLLLVALVWGVLTALAWIRLPTAGFRAVLAASAVATVSAGLAWTFARVGGRVTTVVLAYPFAVAAVLLPPVTAALFSPALGAVILPGSTSLAEWVLDNVLAVADLDTLLRRRFDLAGLAFVGMWFAFAVPIGWVLGLLVTLANAVRPRDEEDEE